MRSTATIPGQRLEKRGMFAHPLAREISFVLVAKFVLLALGFWLLFGPQTRPQLTPDGIFRHLSAAAPAGGSVTTPGGAND